MADMAVAAASKSAAPAAAAAGMYVQAGPKVVPSEVVRPSFLSSRRVSVLGAAVSHGQPRPGVEHGPVRHACVCACVRVCVRACPHDARRTPSAATGSCAK